MFVTSLFFLNLGLVSIKGASFWQGLLEEEVCETKECYDAAAHIKKWMNPAFNPCEDFYEFSCGYWHSPDNSSVNKVYNMSLGARGNIVNFHLKDILQDDEIVKESRLFGMLKQFLSLCMGEETIEASGASPAVEAMRKVGGWPVLEQNWSEEKWNIENTKIIFGGNAIFGIKLGFWSNYTLRIEVMMPDDKISSAKNLSEGFKNQPIKEYYMKGCELAEAFGADKSKAEAEMREAVEFEIAVAEVVRQLKAARNSRRLHPDDIKTLPELQGDIPWVNWTYLITNVLPESVPITKVDKIRISDLERLKELGNLIKTYPKRTVANYVMWKTALILAEYLPAKIRKVAGVKEELNRMRLPFKDRYERCAAYVVESSLIGATASYIAKETVDNTKLAKEMTKNIFNELLLDISELEWIDEKTRSTAVKTLHETKMLIAFPEEVMDLTVLEDIYKEVNINASTFLEAMVDSNRWVRKSTFENLGKSSKPGSELSLKDSIKLGLETAAAYSPRGNLMIVSAGFMHFVPLFGSKVPAYVNYGHLGGIIAHEIIHALDFQTEGLYLDKWMSGLDNSWLNELDNHRDEHVMERWGSNETGAIYKKKKQCIIDQYGSLNDTKYTGLKLNSRYTDREDVADNGGFKLALRAYRKVVANLVSPEPRLPTLQQYSPEQLFVLSLANTYCEIPDRDKRWIQMNWDPHSPLEFRAKGMAMNSPDFGEWFHCQKGDPMDPEEKCEVW